MQGAGVLFVCYGNACRSILAEALARHYWGTGVRIASAGIMPLGYVTPDTLQVLEEAGIPSVGLYSKGLKDVDLSAYQTIVNLTDMRIEEFLSSSFTGRILPCYIPDHFGRGVEAFRRARDEIAELLKQRVPRLAGLEI